MSSDDYLNNSYENSDDDLVSSFKPDSLSPLDLERFVMNKMISYGGAGWVFLITEKATNQNLVAMVKKSSGDITTIKQIYKEIEILDQISKSDSPFIIKYIGFSLKDFNNESNPAIIYKYAPNGSLDLLLKKERKSLVLHEWDPTQKLIVIFGIAYGMSILHKHNIVHRELSPENVLLDDYLLPLISGFSSAINENDITEGENVGAPAYSAPEMLEDKKYTKSVDVFSFSIIVYEIITGYTPYGNEKISIFKLINKVVNGERPKFYGYVPESYKNLIVKCWSGIPEERPTFEEIVTLLRTDKGFITDGVDEEKYYSFVKTYGESQAPEVEIPDELADKITKFKFTKVHVNYPKNDELLIDIDPIDLSQFQQLKFIGNGSFGEVFKIKEKKTGKVFASKINNKELEFCKPNEIIYLKREITILSKIKFPAILRFIGYSLKNFVEEPNPTIITELSINGSLDNIIELQICGRTPKEWTSTKILITIYGVSLGMSYLHSKDILHRDLKPANIFYDEYLFPKIGDFGLAKEIDSEKSDVSTIYQIGTPLFMSPEIFNESRYSKASDVYAFSILLYEMITLNNPFEGLNAFQIYQTVIAGNRPKFNFEIPSCYRKLIERCWSEKEEDRPTFDEIVNQLENDKEFITDEINENEFLDYIDYVKKNSKTKDTLKPITVDFEELKRIQENDPTLNISFLDLNQFEKKQIIKRLDNFKIYEVINKETKQNCEAKVSTTKITKLSKKEIIHLQREINILSKLNHPSFLKFIGYSPIDFDKQPNPIIITEMPPNKSLNDLLDYERYNEEDDDVEEWNDTKKLINIYGIASGMAYLHNNNIIHRNLNPESIFLDEYLFPKIGNFGLLTKIHTIASVTNQTTIGIKGNPSYSSPEILLSNEYSKESDVYAFGLIVYEIITLEIPFLSIQNFNNLFNEVVTRANRPKIDQKIPDCYRQLIELCWSQNPGERPTFKEITSILKNDKEFITKDVNKEEFEKYVKLIENSNIEFYSENRVVKFDDIIKNKDSTQETKFEVKNAKNDDDRIDSKSKNVSNEFDHTSKSKGENNFNEFNNIYDDLLNKKIIGSIGKEVNNYLLQNSVLISSSPISSDLKIIIGKSTSDNDFILIKTFDKETINKAKIDKLNLEYKIINDLNHPNIAKSLGFFIGSSNEGSSILCEYYSRKLKNVVESIDDIYLVTLIYEIANAMMFIHSKKLIHRNLNIENIFVDLSNHAKIADFGNSILMTVSDQINYTKDLKPCCLSQELLKNKTYNEKVDVFAFGMIMQFILQRGKKYLLKRNDIIEGKKAKIPKFINRVSFSIILKCLSHSQNERPSFKAIVHTIKKFKFKLIDGIDDKIPLIENHLKLIIDEKVLMKIKE